MREYHKIDTVFKRDPANKHKTLLLGDWSRPEFGYLANNEWAFTEKVDGTNIRVSTDPAGWRFGGRTDDAQIPTFLLDRLPSKFEGMTYGQLDVLPGNAVLYGEGYGAKIQKGGGNYRPSADFVLFDVRVGDFWLERHNVEDVAARLGLDVVPVIGSGSLHEMVERARYGITSRWGDFYAEGIVARPMTELQNRAGARVITKIKTRDFFDARDPSRPAPGDQR